MKEFIIGRVITPQEIEAQTDWAADKFQELEQRTQVHLPEVNGFRDFEESGNLPPEIDDSVELDTPPIINRPQKKGRKIDEPPDAKLDLGGKYSLSNTIRNKLEG